MLSPQSRALLTDSLRPPDGWRVDTAITTTYSLDLTALLLAPMSFALHEVRSADLADVNGVALLEALRRHSDRTTVFCQAGGIHLPPTYSPLLQFLEDTVVQVIAPTSGRAFHPKVWVIRFTAVDGTYSHRALVASRNLTFDRCWDTLLRLDELPADATARTVPDPAPLADFVEALPTMAEDGTPTRRDQVLDVVSTLRTARFGMPENVSSLAFVPMGLAGTDSQWPFPATASRALFISPFLSAGAVKRAAELTPHATFLSRPDALDGVGASAFDDHHEAWTLQRSAEVEAGEDGGTPDPAVWEGTRIRDGLHAKTSIIEHGATTTIVTGSANLTTAGFGGNVEFDVVMTGPTAQCGIDAIWDGQRDSTGLSQLCAPYEPGELDEDAQATAAAEQRIADFHARLSSAHPLVAVSAGTEEDTADLVLRFDEIDDVGDTFVWLASLQSVHARPLVSGSDVSWTGVARSRVTPFIAIQTTVTTPYGDVTATSVVKGALQGDVGNRRQIAMRDILKSPADVLRYLSLLLADPSRDVTALAAGLSVDGGPQERRAVPTDIVLLEPLVRASARSDDALARVASILDELREMPDGESLVPPGLDAIWSAVWAAREHRP